MFDPVSPATISTNVQRLAAALVDGREVKMYAVMDDCDTPACILGWALALGVSDFSADMSDEQRQALMTPLGFDKHTEHSPAVARAAASELLRLHAGGEPNPNWLNKAIAGER